MSLLNPVLWIVLMIPLFLLAYFTSKETNLKFLAFFILYFLIDSYVQLSPEYLNLPSFGLQFGWISKMLSIAISLLLLFFLSKKSRKEIGFTKSIHKKTTRLGILLFIGYLIIDFIIKFIIFPKGGDFDLEAFLFQAIMPGISEELAYRGIGLWLLSKAFPPTWNIKGIKFGWGFVIITILFGVVHGVIIDSNLEFQLDIVTILYITTLTSLALGFLRKFTDNISFNILGHNIVNVMNAFIRIL